VVGKEEQATGGSFEQEGMGVAVLVAVRDANEAHPVDGVEPHHVKGRQQATVGQLGDDAFAGEEGHARTAHHLGAEFAKPLHVPEVQVREGDHVGDDRCSQPFAAAPRPELLAERLRRLHEEVPSVRQRHAEGDGMTPEGRVIRGRCAVRAGAAGLRHATVLRGAEHHHRANPVAFPLPQSQPPKSESFADSSWSGVDLKKPRC